MSKVVINIPDVQSKLDEILAQIEDTKREILMALTAQAEALRKQLDDATTAIGAEIQTFINNATNAGSVASAEVVTALQPIADKLTALAGPTTTVTPTP